MTSSLARKPSSKSAATVEHVCPVCRARHEVSTVRNELAYGRQLCCSPDCESERRRRWRVATRIDRAARFAPKLPQSEARPGSWMRTAAAIALLAALLAAGFALRFHAFYPQLF